MKLNKNLSLCTVVANSEDCLPIFFNWSLPRFEEIILVKSDSTDKTNEILDRYKKKYSSQITLIYKKIVDIASQKQYCIELSTKKYQLVIDADEVCEDIDWDNLVNQLESNNIDLVHLPRYNLQKDIHHYLSTAYPDLQPRLFKSGVRFADDPIYQTHHIMVGASNQIAIKFPHIIHWGHIRNEKQLQWKSNMRRRYADTDLCDGQGLKTHSNWYFERNKELDNNIKPLPDNVKNFIQLLS